MSVEFGQGASSVGRYAAEYAFYQVIDDFNQYVQESRARDGSGLGGLRPMYWLEARKIHDEIFSDEAVENLGLVSGINEVRDAVMRALADNPKTSDWVNQVDNETNQIVSRQSWDRALTGFNRIIGRQPGSVLNALGSDGRLLPISPYDVRYRDREMFDRDSGICAMYVDMSGFSSIHQIEGDFDRSGFDPSNMNLSTASVYNRNTFGLNEQQVERAERDFSVMTANDVFGISRLRSRVSDTEYKMLSDYVSAAYGPLLAPDYDFRSLGRVAGVFNVHESLAALDNVSEAELARYDISADDARATYLSNMQKVMDRAIAILDALDDHGYKYTIGRDRYSGQIVASVTDTPVSIRIIDKPDSINMVGRTYHSGSRVASYVRVGFSDGTYDGRFSGRVAEDANLANTLNSDNSVHASFNIDNDIFVDSVMYVLGEPVGLSHTVTDAELLRQHDVVSLENGGMSGRSPAREMETLMKVPGADVIRELLDPESMRKAARAFIDRGTPDDVARRSFDNALNRRLGMLRFPSRAGDLSVATVEEGPANVFRVRDSVFLPEHLNLIRDIGWSYVQCARSEVESGRMRVGMPTLMSDASLEDISELQSHGLVLNGVSIEGHLDGVCAAFEREYKQAITGASLRGNELSDLAEGDLANQLSPIGSNVAGHHLMGQYNGGRMFSYYDQHDRHKNRRDGLSRNRRDSKQGRGRSLYNGGVPMGYVKVPYKGKVRREFDPNTGIRRMVEDTNSVIASLELRTMADRRVAAPGFEGEGDVTDDRAFATVAMMVSQARDAFANEVDLEEISRRALQEVNDSYPDIADSLNVPEELLSGVSCELVRETRALYYRFMVDGYSTEMRRGLGDNVTPSHRLVTSFPGVHADDISNMLTKVNDSLAHDREKGAHSDWGGRVLAVDDPEVVASDGGYVTMELCRAHFDKLLDDAIGAVVDEHGNRVQYEMTNRSDAVRTSPEGERVTYRVSSAKKDTSLVGMAIRVGDEQIPEDVAASYGRFGDGDTFWFDPTNVASVASGIDGTGYSHNRNVLMTALRKLSPDEGTHFASLRRDFVMSQPTSGVVLVEGAYTEEDALALVREEVGLEYITDPRQRAQATRELADRRKAIETGIALEEDYDREFAAGIDIKQRMRGGQLRTYGANARFMDGLVRFGDNHMTVGGTGSLGSDGRAMERTGDDAVKVYSYTDVYGHVSGEDIPEVAPYEGAGEGATLEEEVQAREAYERAVAEREAAVEADDKAWAFRVGVMHAVQAAVESSGIVLDMDGEYPDISMDSRGVVRYRGRFRDGNGGLESVGIEGEVGQFFMPDADGLVVTDFAGSDNKAIAFGYEAYVLSAHTNDGSALDRTRYRSFYDKIMQDMRMQIREDIDSVAISGRSVAGKEFVSVGSPVSVNGSYSHFLSMRKFDLDHAEKAKELGFPEETHRRVVESEKTKVRYVVDDMQHATSVTQEVGELRDASDSRKRRRAADDRHRSALADFDHRRTSAVHEDELGLKDPFAMKDGLRSVDSFRLVDGVMFSYDEEKRLMAHPVDVQDDSGHAGFAEEGSQRNVLLQDPLFAHSQYDSWFRVQMAYNNVRHAYGVTDPVGVAYISAGGATQDDGCRISKTFAEAHAVPDAYGNPRPLDTHDKISDLHGNKNIISKVVDPSLEGEPKITDPQFFVHKARYEAAMAAYEAALDDPAICSKEGPSRDMYDNTDEGAADYRVAQFHHRVLVRDRLISDDGVPVEPSVETYADADAFEIEHQIWQVFHDNPNLSVIAPPDSAISRKNAGTFREALANGSEELKLSDGSVVPGGIAYVRMLLQDKTWESKISLENGVNCGWQMSSVLNSMKLKDSVLSAVYGSNYRGEDGLREAMRTGFGIDVAEDGELSSELLMHSDDVADSADGVFRLSRLWSGHDVVTDTGGVAIAGAKRAFVGWLSRTGGYMEVPFEVGWEGSLQGRNGNEDISYTASVPKVPGQNVWRVPVMAADQRMGSELVDGEYKAHDYTGQYVSMYDDVVRREAAWRSCLIATCKAIDKVTGSQDFLDPSAKGNDRFTDKALDLEQRLDSVDWTHDRDAALSVVREFVTDALGESSPQLSKTLGRLAGEYDKARTKSDSLEESFRRRFEGLSQRVREEMFEEKKNFAKTHVMTNKVPMTSVTAVWGADPSLDLDQIAMPQELADVLGVGENYTIFCGRPPQLHDGCIRAFRVTIREGIHGVNSNPEVAPIINGDYDGDSVSLISFHDPRVVQDVARFAALELEVVDPRHVDSEGRHKIMVGHGPDLKRTMFHNPKYKAAYDMLCERMQDVYAAHCTGVDEDGNKRGPENRFDDAYLMEMRPLLVKMNRLIKHGQALGCCKSTGVLDLSTPGSVVKSMVDVCVEPGAKGNYATLGSLCEYAGFRSENHEGLYAADTWEHLCTSVVMPAMKLGDKVDDNLVRTAVMNALDDEAVNWREDRNGFESWLTERLGDIYSDGSEIASVVSGVMTAYDEAVELGRDVVIDYDSIIAEDHTLHTYGDDISTQDATALKTVATGEMGMFMQELLMAFPDQPDIACTLSFPLYQKSLDWKHDGEQAVREYVLTPEVRDLLYDGRIGPDGDLGTPKMWADALMNMYERLGFDDVNREYVDRAAQLLVEKDGKVHGARARAEYMCPPVMAAAFQRSGAALVTAAEEGKHSLYGAMVDAVDNATLLFYATQSVRDCAEKGTGKPLTYETVMQNEFASKSDVIKTHAESVRHERMATGKDVSHSVLKEALDQKLQSDAEISSGVPLDSLVSKMVEVVVPVHLHEGDALSDSMKRMPQDGGAESSVYAEAQHKYSDTVGMDVSDLLAMMNIASGKSGEKAAVVAGKNGGSDYGE